jgi:GNAT superfamily N-acetyltransferase
MTIQSLFEIPHRFDECMDFIASNFGNREFHRQCFADSTKSADMLPQGYMLIKDDSIIGFVGLLQHECVAGEVFGAGQKGLMSDQLTPWISPMAVAPQERGHEYGTLLLRHVREQAGKLGFVKLYLTTNHIGYYEKYGFREFGLTSFKWGHPTKIYTINAIGLSKITERILADYPGVQAILLRGSFARGDGVDVQDIDLTVITTDTPAQEELHIFENGIFYDIAFVAKSALADRDTLLCDPYLAGAYAESQVLFDANGDMAGWLSDFRAKYPQPQYLSKRVAALKDNLKSQYANVLAALKNEDAIAAHCRFATYTWTLCDVVNVKKLQSPGWIRGLQKVGRADKTMMNKIIDAESHRYLGEDVLLLLLDIYSELWQGEFWDFLKSEMTWLAGNNQEPQAFHAIQICIMMGIENRDDKAEYYARWKEIVGDVLVLPLRSKDEFEQFHTDNLMVLNMKPDAVDKD